MGSKYRQCFAGPHYWIYASPPRHTHTRAIALGYDPSVLCFRDFTPNEKHWCSNSLKPLSMYSNAKQWLYQNCYQYVRHGPSVFIEAISSRHATPTDGSSWSSMLHLAPQLLAGWLHSFGHSTMPIKMRLAAMAAKAGSTYSLTIRRACAWTRSR